MKKLILFLMIFLFFFSVNALGNYTSEEITIMMNESSLSIKEMQSNGFSTLYVEDKFNEAEKIFTQAYYASILRGEINVSDFEKMQARESLSLISWRTLDYSAVVPILNEIENHRNQAFEINDLLFSLEIELNDFYGNFSKLDPIPISVSSFIEAKNSFIADRYNETQNFIVKSKESFEAEKLDSSRFNILQRGVKGFFLRFWYVFLIILILIILGVVFFYKKFKIYSLRKKIDFMRHEEKVLNDLMKEVQTQRFKEEKISGLVYNTRMNKYKERLQEIKQTLPVLEKKLRMGK